MTIICGGPFGRLAFSGALISTLLLYLFWHRGNTALPLSKLSSALHIPSFSPHSSSSVYDSSYIWQIRFDHDDSSETRRKAWVDLNPNRTYVFLDRAAGDELVATHFSHRADIVTVWRELSSRILRSDLLRYLALAAEGGVYADLDAVPKKPVDEWIPAEYRGGRARAAIGVEFDQRHSNPNDVADHNSMRWNGMDWPVQFCQWTILSWAAHPLLLAMVDQVTSEILALAERHGGSLADLEPDDGEVTRTTGPSAWTRLIFKELSKEMGEQITWRNVTMMTAPRLFGDVLILPINAYGAGQEHSGSSRAEDVPDALVRHLFEGFWKHNWNGRE